MQLEVYSVISKAVLSSFLSYISHSSAPPIDRCPHYHLFLPLMDLEADKLFPHSSDVYL